MKNLIDKIITGLTTEEYHYLLVELNCSVIQTDLPLTSFGFTLRSDDGYLVYINTRTSDEQQRITLQHEFRHIYDEDFKQGKALHIKENGGDSYEIRIQNTKHQRYG